MTDPEPISLEEFTAALESLDRAEFASFVGQLRAVTADEVDVEPPLVTVRTGDTLTELLVGTPDPGSETDPGEIDGIVTRAEEPPDVDVDATSITPSDLRQRLLWGLRVNEAQALCERALGMPAYSTRYAVTPSSAGTTASDPPRQEPASSRTERPVLLVSLVAFVVLAAGAGGVFVMGTGDSVTALLGVDDTTDEPPSEVEPLEEPGAVGLEPTCNRSYLHVVQIQMNALKYNNDTTNDGIRTVRQFASLQNRQAVGSVEDYARLIKGGSYAPMLSYDSVRYTPRRINDTAWVEVVTFENDTETGRYEFRLSTSRTDTERYDGCWMTDSVRVLQESTEREQTG
jgi:hypothetical protein